MLISAIKNPHREMLESLSHVSGYSDYKCFLERDHKTTFWKTEIKALFEVDKPNHPLLAIESTEKGGAEGIFKIGDQDVLVEASDVSFFAESNDTKQKCWNSINQFVTPLRKYIPSGKFVIFTAPTDWRPSVGDKNCLLNALQNSSGEPFELSSSCYVEIRDLTFLEQKDLAEKSLTRTNVILIASADGAPGYFGENTNLLGKLRERIREKRKQHAAKSEPLRLYYLATQCFFPQFRRLSLNALERDLKINEAVVVTATEGAPSGRLQELKTIISGDEFPVQSMDLTNRFYDWHKL